MKIFFINCFKVFILISLLFTSQRTFTQTCDYVEGTITFNATGGNTTANYANEYLLVNDGTGEILQRSTSSSFPSVTQGTYDVYNINYETATTGGEGTSVTGIGIGDNISGIGGLCYALSAPMQIVVCKLELEWVDVSDTNPESIATYQPTLTISGGDISGVTMTTTVEVVLSGTATMGTDFNPNVATIILTIPKADYTTPTTLNLNDLTTDDFSVIDDNLQESDEDVVFTLQNPVGLDIADVDATDGIESVHTYTITDNDELLIEFADATASGIESMNQNLPQIIISGAIINSPVTIDVALMMAGSATSGVDFGLASGSFPMQLTIPAGDYTTATTLTVNDLTTQDLNIIDDALVEVDETFTLALQNGSSITIGDADGADGIESQFTYTIVDDDCMAAARTLSK